MPNTKAKSAASVRRSQKVAPQLDVASLKLGEDTVNKIVDWVKRIEAHLDKYYVDSLEIDLGITVPFNIGGKLTIKNKTGQATGHLPTASLSPGTP
jgi:hypothetical protein